MRVTAEWVAPGHPDKICDRISDAILDACLRQDSKSRVAVETLGGHDLLVIAGEVTTKAEVNYEDIARRTIANEKTKIIVNIVEQSPEIANGVDNNGALGFRQGSISGLRVGWWGIDKGKDDSDDCEDDGDDR
jgi:S-adenosylmethionine synthetase